MKKFSVAVAILVLFASANVFAKDIWAHPYFGVGLQYYGFSSAAVSEAFGSNTVAQMPGIRLFGGIEVNNMFLGAEAAWSMIVHDPTLMQERTDLVVSLHTIPVKFTFAYELPFFTGAAVIPQLGLGFMLGMKQGYDDEDAYDAELLTNKTEISLLASIGLTMRFGWKADHLFVFAHAGFDGMVTKDGTKGLPTFSAGVMLYPFGVPEVQTGVKIKRPNVLFYNPIYFAEDTYEILQRYKPILDAAGQLLQNEENTIITIRAFAEPGKNAEDQMALSAQRARHCAAYLEAYYMINGSRIVIEFYGNKTAPDNAVHKVPETYRAAELIVYETDFDDDAIPPPPIRTEYSEGSRQR